MSYDESSKLNASSDGVSDEEWAKSTQLRAAIREVDAFNWKHLSSLPGAVVTYSSKDEISVAISHPRRVLYAARHLQDAAPSYVSVKPGAVILLTRAVRNVASSAHGCVVHCGTDHLVVGALLVEQ